MALGATDMRKSINTLSVIVEACLKRSPFSGDLFVFCNRRQTHIKVLYWDDNGFCLWLKRLEKGRFRWPENETDMLQISARSFRWLLDGLELTQTKAHKKLTFQSVL